MVVPALSLGALVGVVFSGGFVWWRVGRYATPQVPITLFDERRELFAYTAGLFVGVPLAIVGVLFLDSMANGALPGAAIFLALLLVGTEAAQWALLRTRFWGHSESGPFYALGYRAAIGGIIALAIVAQYLSGPSISALGIGSAVLEAAAVVGLEASGAILSVRPRPGSDRATGGPLRGALFGAFGFFLIGVGALGGGTTAVVGAVVALLGAALVYRRLEPALASIPAPGRGPAPATAPLPSEYGRTGRPPPPAGRDGGGESPPANTS